MKMKTKILLKLKKNNIIHFLKRFLDVLFPHLCPSCSKIILQQNALCGNCWSKLNFINNPKCLICSNPFSIQISKDDVCVNCINNPPRYKKLFCSLAYEDFISSIIFKFKFYDYQILSYLFANIISNNILQSNIKFDYIIPVPLHIKRLRKRKYNQALLLSRALSNNLETKYIYDFIVRKKNTSPQVSLRGEARKKNLINSFSINEKYNANDYKNKKFLLVDDVVTTGSTINECISALNAVKIENVYVACLARTVKI